MTQHSAATLRPTDGVDADHRGPEARRPRRGLSLVAALATVLLVGVGAAAAVATSAASSSTVKDATATTSGATVTGPDARATDPDGAGALVSPDSEPVADPEPEPEPEPEAPATPGDLEVSTNSIDLPDNVYDGNFEVRNDGGSPIEWHWLMGDYGIAVDVDGGTLAPGESVTVHFSINPFQLPVGDFLFANSVYTDDQAKDIHITGYRPQFKVNPDAQQPGLGLTK